MKMVLVTGFEPFGGAARNPSGEIARALHGRTIEGRRVRGAVLPVAYWSTLPVKAIVAALEERQIPAKVSLSAGTFVCNHLFYGLMHALLWQRAVRGGFIHVPPAAEPGAKDGMALATMIEGIELAIATSLRTRARARGTSNVR